MGPDLLKAWRTFESQVVPITAGTIQRQEMRRAFFAGAWSVLTELPVCGLGNGERAADLMREQCRAFKEDVQAGHA